MITGKRKFRELSDETKVKISTSTMGRPKTAQHKAKGLTVCAYNKAAEISTSEKDYILGYYGNLKRIYRLEIHLNSQDVTDYFNSIGKGQDLSLIMDADLMDAMYFHHLSAVIRFAKGRQPFLWSDLLNCTGRGR